jgi:scyllo-inositol 2-dehydrogenase (NADP+)
MTARVALLGYGLAGRVFHAPLINAEPELALTAIVTANAERREQAAADNPGVEILATADEVWDRADEFDLAIVATANSAHVPQATAALENGLHVVVDKPLAATAALAQSLVDLAASVNRQLHVFQNRRWDSEILTARAAIADGVLGRPHRLESRFERWRPSPKGGWREVGAPEDIPGLLYDLGAHVVDQALHLMGPVERVAASARILRDGVTGDDDTQVMLWHSGGAISILSVSAVAAFIEPRLRLLGTRGGLEIIGLDTQEDALRAGRSPQDQDWGMEPDEHTAMIVTADDVTPRPYPRQRGSYPTYYAGVARSIIGQGPAPVDARDVVQNLRVIEAAARSSAEGIEVRLEPPAGHVNDD